MGVRYSVPDAKDVEALVLKPEIREFPGISHAAFQHPLDKQALTALEKTPLLPMFTKKFSEVFTERFIHIQRVSGNLRVSAQQYPSLYHQYIKLAQVLDVKKLPDLYIETNPQINAFAMGLENYTIVLYSGLIDIMEEDELLAIIGHELGHVKCEHMLYVTMANALQLFGSVILENFLPLVGSLANVTIQLALLEWYRKAEFSCDRAALLAVQEEPVVSNALAKLGGFSKRLGGQIDLEQVKRQAAEYQDIGADSVIDKTIKLYVLMQQTHPYPVVRVSEIIKWANSPEYQQILQGKYQVQLADATEQGMALAPLSTPTGLTCSRCKSVWPAGTAFCGKCAMNLRGAQMICGRCLTPISPEWSACSRCGNALK